MENNNNKRCGAPTTRTDLDGVRPFGDFQAAVDRQSEQDDPADGLPMVRVPSRGEREKNGLGVRGSAWWPRAKRRRRPSAGDRPSARTHLTPDKISFQSMRLK